jgi:hypothetical protein
MIEVSHLSAFLPLASTPEGNSLPAYKLGEEVSYEGEKWKVLQIFVGSEIVQLKVLFPLIKGSIEGPLVLKTISLKYLGLDGIRITRDDTDHEVCCIPFVKDKIPKTNEEFRTQALSWIAKMEKSREPYEIVKEEEKSPEKTLYTLKVAIKPKEFKEGSLMKVIATSQAMYFIIDCNFCFKAKHIKLRTTQFLKSFEVVKIWSA